MAGMEGFNRVPEQESGEQEKAKEMVYAALAQLEGEGRRVYDSIHVPGITRDEFAHRIREFNNLSAEDRGKGNYKHDRTLDERKEYEHGMTFPQGRYVLARVHKNGELDLSFFD